MAKYDTGGGGSRDDAAACELCGRESSSLRRATVAGAELLVCPDCAPHGQGKGQTRDRGEQSSHQDAQQQQSDAPDGPEASERRRKKRTAQRAAKMYDATRGDSSRWEQEGTNYERDRLPYLVSGYGELVETARQDAGLRIEELAAELDVDESDLLAVEQGRATRAGVGGSVIHKLEDRFGIQLADDPDRE